MRRLLLSILLLLTIPITVEGADLYEVRLSKSGDAVLLRSSGAEALVRVGNEYLVLADESAVAYLQHNALDHTLIARDVDAARLAVDRRTDRENVGRYELLYERDGIRLYRVAAEEREAAVQTGDLLSLADKRARIVYTPAREAIPAQAALTFDLDSLIALVSQDTIESYLNRLQAFQARKAGTDSIKAARDWIRGRFVSFGYDSVYVDTFMANISGVMRQCYNVVAVRPGSLYPDSQVVIGAHHDGVAGSPAADDNGSGTVGVLEMARVLADSPNDVTLIFITFDAEESGLLGAYHYAAAAAQRGDDIKVMFNMDMIAWQPNSTQAKLFHGPNSGFASQWIALATPLVGIQGILSGNSSGSDHWPFHQYGYSVVFLHEYVFSGVYHSSLDSTTYCNFDYMTRMIQASLALIYSNSAGADLDADGVADAVDNCRGIPNHDQANSDGDPLGDACDNCPQITNAGQENLDGDAWGDVCDNCVAHATPGNVPIHTGDVNDDGALQASDIVYMVAYVFRSGVEPLPAQACGDVNCDGTITSSDIIDLVNYVFKSGDPPCDVCQP
jgi:hypothetical protein